MNHLQLFENNQFGKIRVVEIINGEPWFNLSDVCKILKIGNASDVAKRLDEDDLDSIEVGVKTGVRKDGSNIIQNVKANFVNK